MRTQLDEWSDLLTKRATALDKELGGFDELRGIWKATGDLARAQNAPSAVRERIDAVLASLATSRKAIEQRRQQSLELQDAVVAQSAATRAPLRELGNIRRQSFGRLLIADRGPVWSTYPAEGLRPPIAAAIAATREDFVLAGQYLRDHLPRVLLQIVTFLLLAIYFHRARGRIASLVKEDESMARGARVFEVPVSAAAVVTLIATGWFLPDAPLLIGDMIGLAALFPNLRVLRRLVDPPAYPALWAIGVFYAVDQLTRYLSSQPFLEQLLFTLERVGAIIFLVWFIRSGRFRAMWSRDSRWAPTIERAARLLVLLITFSTVAGALGFMQLSRYIQETMIDSAYAALVLYGGLQVLESVWAYLLRTRLARELYMVTRHRALLQRRGDALLGWIAGLTWVVVVLRNAHFLDPITSALREMLGAQATVGSLTVSAGAVLAFAFTVWLSFTLSRFLRFVLAEDVCRACRSARHAVRDLDPAALRHAARRLRDGARRRGHAARPLRAARRRVRRRHRLRPAERRQQLRLRPDPAVRAPGADRRHDRGGHVCGRGAPHRHPLEHAAHVRGRRRDRAECRPISGAVTNWTFSDRTRRIDIPIGVAYGTDPSR